MPAHLQGVRTAREHRVPRGQVGDHGAGQRPQPCPLGLHRADAGGLERRGGHRAHGHGQDGVGEGGQHPGAHALLPGDLQQARRGRGAGEGDRVDPMAGDRRDQPAQRCGEIGRAHV